MSKKISIYDFLTKYTAISEKFIKEYYKFYILCENDVFGINIDAVMDYLEVNGRTRFVQNFRKGYVENVDFIRKELVIEKTKSIKTVFYYLTLDTFEKVCMRSNAKKAVSVRDYFITLRKFIQYYKDNISEMIMTKANSKNCVYILSVNKKKDIFKLGITSDMRKRLKTYATGHDTHPLKIQSIFLISNL